jgi:cytochrome c55X
MRARVSCGVMALTTLVVSAGGAGTDAGQAQRQALLARGAAALRAMDCARCHGRDYNGWAAPSLIAGVRDAPRERFDHYVLEGDIARGMPGYKSQPLVVAELDAMYAYLRARAGPLNPAPAPGGASSVPLNR